MSALDRLKWDQRYAEPADPDALEPRDWLVEIAAGLPSEGRALDIAGGSGRHALWLAARGLRTTLVDVSSVALRLAAEEAVRRGLALSTQQLDLEVEALPAGPWELILVSYYLNRALFGSLPESLAPGGFLVVVHPTRTNLARHARPPADFLLDDGELPGLVAGLEVSSYAEGWQRNDKHEARLVARRR